MPLWKMTFHLSIRRNTGWVPIVQWFLEAGNSRGPYNFKLYSKMLVFFFCNGVSGDFPGSPVVKTSCFHCRGTDSIPGQGTKIPQTTECGKKKKSMSVLLLQLRKKKFLQPYLEERWTNYSPWAHSLLLHSWEWFLHFFRLVKQYGGLPRWLKW